MFGKRNPSEARPSGTSAPRGKMLGKTPSQPGHPVKGRGLKSTSKGAITGKTMKSGGTKVGGHGTKSSRGGVYTG